MATADRLDALVLDLDTRGGLSVARSLAARGYRFAIASRDGRASGMRTRHAQGRLVLPDPAVDLAACGEALCGWLAANPVDVVLLCSDQSLAVVHGHRDRIARLASPALGGRAAVDVARSKSRTLRLAAGLGIPCPRSLEVSTPEAAVAAAHELGLPVVLKPAASWRDVGGGGERVAPVCLDTPAAAARLARELVREDAPALVQELAQGVRETHKLFRVAGRTLAHVVMRSDRTWPPLGGQSVMRRTIAPPRDSTAHAQRLVAALELDGYSEVEFRRDAAGTPLLMEVNPRLSQSVELAARAGVDVACRQLEWARGGTVEPAPRYRRVAVGWLAGEGRLLAASLGPSPAPRPDLTGTLAAIARDYLLDGAGVDSLDLRDPAPAAAALAFTARAVVRRGVGLVPFGHGRRTGEAACPPGRA